jgi:hypothetical protein
VSSTQGQLSRLRTVYAARDTDTHRAVHDAAQAVLSGACTSPVVVLALDCLVGLYEAKADLPDIERAERYVAEAWAEVNP